MDYDPQNRSGSGSFGATGGSTGSTGATGNTGASTGTTGTTGGSTDSFSGTGNTGSGDMGTRAGSYDRKFIDADTDSGNLRDRVSEKVEEGREAVGERVGSALDTGRNRIADQMERASGRLSERAREMEDTGGVQRRAGQVALRASGALESGADYLRTHEMDQMRDDLEHAIRERPLLSVGVAVGAGFLLARLLRD